MTTYQQLFDSVLGIAKSYSMEQFMDGFTPELVNILLNNHITKIEQATTYEITLKLLSDAVSSHLGVQMSVENFITKVQDREILYDIFQQWRSKLLQLEDESSKEREI